MSAKIDSSKFEGRHYEVFKSFLEDVCGIVLGDNKHYLVSCRLCRILEKHNINDLTELVTALKKSSNSKLKENVIDAMTTNETLWFRDGYPFTMLAETIIPEIRQGKVLSRPLRIWSAAASTGQEAYSISMIISEYVRINPGSMPGDAQIIGTDISRTVLDQATAAEYDELALGRGLSPARKRLFFDDVGNKKLRVKAKEKNRVSFRQLNLLDGYASMGKFDVIFCRNVLIYFSPEVKDDILRRMANALNPRGYLYVGGTESLGPAGELFEMIRCNPGIIYRKK